MMNKSNAVIATATVLLLVHGCATTQGARPDDMSATEHRAHAAAEESEAAGHAEQYNPEASADKSVQGGPGQWDTISYNPTALHKEQAEEHKEHAEAHRAAAAELEHFAEAECKSFPPATRKICPLLGTVEGVEEIEDGIAVRLSAELDREAALAHVKCHLAYARKEGRKGMDSCPLYVDGVVARVGTDDRIIELRVEDAEDLATLRQRTRDHVEK